MEDWDRLVLFLLMMKQGAQNGLRFAERKKNLDTLARLGISIEDAKQRVLALTPRDALCTPEDGEQPNERKCEFGLQVNGDEVWIRVVVEIGSDDDCQSVVLSFHDPERPTHYLFGPEE